MAAAESFVLAGGKSSRMGQDKALLTIGGATLVELTLKKLGSLGGSVPRIAGSRSDLSRWGEAISDLHPECGPLGGIEAALAATSQPLNLFLAVDLPLIPARFLSWMLERALITGARVTVPRVGGYPQPLCAVYHRDLLALVRAAMEEGNYKVMAVMRSAAKRLGDCDVFDMERVVAASRELPSYSPLPFYLWFHNCNTPEDLTATRNALVWTA